MSLSLAIKYRPQTFEDVVGQSMAVKILQKQIETKTFKNVYLFTGPSGTGKTSIAKIMANQINNNQGLPIEIDAASNSGVDNVRQIIEDANVKSLDSYYKVYIIDECHSLSNTAWQAFLKCLEEPPIRTIFIFCTTDAQKIPNTILSRVHRFDFQKLSYEQIVSRLDYISTKELFIADNKDGIEYIAKLAEGGMRDAITMLDKVASYSLLITLENVVKVLGVINYETIFELTNGIIDRKELEVLNIINKQYEQGVDLKIFINQYLLFILDTIKYSLSKSFDCIKIPKLYENELINILNIEGYKDFYNLLLDKLISLKEIIKWETNIKSYIDMNFLIFCRS